MDDETTDGLNSLDERRIGDHFTFYSLVPLIGEASVISSAVPKLNSSALIALSPIGKSGLVEMHRRKRWSTRGLGNRDAGP